jgi:lipopolysaccharide biosynthesis protein
MRKCIVVLGMHRSGTSAMAGLLEIFGVYLGENLLRENNEKDGLEQFENRTIYDLNEQLLESVGSSWDDISKIKISKFNNKKSKEIINKIKLTLFNDFGSNKLFCIKDPRISLLIPIYVEIFNDLEIEPYFIIMNRNHIEVARSLEERNGFLFRKSFSLYDKYYDSIHNSILDNKKIELEFDNLITNTKDCYNLIQKKFELELKPFSKINSSIKSFLDPKLKYHNLDVKNNYFDFLKVMNERDEIINNKDQKIGDLSSEITSNLNMLEFMGAELNHLKLKLANIENSITWRSVKKLDWITKPLLFDTGIINNSVPQLKNISDLSNKKIAVIFHLYYEDLWDEIMQYIDRIPIKFDLYVNLVKGHSKSILNKIKKRYPDCKITVSNNAGYDMGGLIRSLEIIDLEDYDLICKVHTKKADYRSDGSIWREKLLDSILGSREKIFDILRIFDSDPKIGIVGSNEFINREDLGSNSKFYSQLCGRLKIPFRKRGLEFIAGSIFWCRSEIMNEIKKLNLSSNNFESSNKLDGQLAHAIERIFGALGRKLGYKIKGVDTGYHLRGKSVPLHDARNDNSVKPICFYFPQYHVIPENEKWWGKGFTEWNNVKNGKPLFRRHYQPKIPGELGYYNLDEVAVAERQAKLARDSGIHGFCYYYYWFNGKKLLNKPIERMLETKKPDFPFCVCWANENWTRVWDGRDDKILMKQSFSKEDCNKFIDEMAPYFGDKRYIGVNGKPLLVIYRIDNVLNPIEFIASLRDAAKRNGFEIHISLVQSFSRENPTKYGFDSAIEFPPSKPEIPSSKDKVSNLSKNFKGEIFDYNKVFEKFSQRKKEDYTLFFGTTPGWDNASRRKENSVVLINSNPENYKKWLEHTVVKTKSCYRGDERLIFINAWNEWGEGCYLEPDSIYGEEYLKVTREVLEKYNLIR